MSYPRAIAACRTELTTVNKTFLASVMCPGENGKYYINISLLLLPIHKSPNSYQPYPVAHE